MNSPPNALLQEVEALRALYGDHRISFLHERNHASITISLADLTPLTPPMTLSAILPPTYPTHRPHTPTLRGGGLAAAECAQLVQQLLAREQSLAHEVCLYEYAEAAVSVLTQRADRARPLPPEARVAAGTWVVRHGEPVTDRRSVFQAHVARISAPEDVPTVLAVLRESRKVENAAHNTFAFRVSVGDGVAHDFDDDGEKGAGKCVLYVLQQRRAVGVVCVVTRWFGGTKLGPVRFRHIAGVARDVLDAHPDFVPREELPGAGRKGAR